MICLLGISIVNAQQKNLWASTNLGGWNGYGTILKGDSDGTNFHAVFSFSYADGYFLVGSLGIADNGKIYGHTQEGGTGDSCTVFCMDTSTYQYTVIHDDENTPQYGVIPLSGITPYTDGKFYGTSSGGGANNAGVIFTIDPVTNAYTDIYDFDTLTGGYPWSELLLLPDGKFYGGGYGGGVNHRGLIYSFDPTTHQYTALYNPSPDSSQVGISGNKLLLATDGRFYSTCQDANPAHFDDGYLFSYKPGDSTLKLLHKFFWSEFPVAAGVMQASNGKIYGMTNRTQYDQGQTYGEIYSYNIATDSFAIEYNFTDSSGYGGAQIFTELGNGKLLGSTMLGGRYGFGVIFTFDPQTRAFTKLLELDSINTGAHSTAPFLLTGVKTTYCKTLPTHIADNFCSGTVYNFGNQHLTAAGIYYDTLSSLHGCDSVIILNLSSSTVSVSWSNTTDSVITTNSPVNLTGGSPAGGTYSGSGVWNNIFYPDSANSGNNTITYSYADSNGCSSSVSKIFRVVTGVENTVVSQLQLYPNPANEEVILNCGNLLIKGQPEFYDVTGRILSVEYTRLNNTFIYNIQSLAPGTYYIKLQERGNLVCKRFVKEK